ncbi:RNA polymerase sigma factor [Fundicoccus culcitae]|uniref:Sigma-70 family RNA polymerase sigma factor n=1 Tax=Fundicoccus culcitae TaxID=2969821 RepID=A0ABY5P2T5_9LACT|nr:sigma-70 family RNA polymerase sigma factor [Fundicoccus culcitae]UUX33038.1 sigma-70 family RNA polymerase sigma factor [Fundicoccus culcitae]
MLPNHQLTNEELVLQLQKNFDVDKFEILFKRYLPLFLKYRSLYKVTYFDTDDYLQEARIAILKAIKVYDCVRSPYLSALIQSVYRYHLINMMRESQTVKREKDFQNLPFIDIVYSKNGKDTLIDGVELIENKYTLQPPEIFEIQEKSNDYLQSLSRLEKRILQLYLDNYSHREIAEITGIRFDQVQNAFDRLRRKLFAILKV